MCVHLEPVETYIKSNGFAEYWRGQPWTQNCREWVYFDCILDTSSISAKLNLHSCVTVHDYNDVKAGSERGFICSICKDGIMGRYPDSLGSGKPVLQ